MSPMRIATIAHNTIREAVRHKLLYAVLVVSVLMIFASVLISTLSYVEGTRIMQDFGFAAIRIFSAATAVFIGINLLHSEVDRRTIYTILSKPISRVEFLLGKYAGLVLTTWLMLAALGAIFLGVSLLAGAPVHAGHAAAMWLIAVELTIVVAIATFFSSITTPMLAALFTSGLYVAGHLTQNLYHLAMASDDAGVQRMAVWIYRVLPDLELYNLTVQAVHGLAIPAGEIWLPVAYAALYTAILLMAASALFARRDLR
ncbi:MAG: ABC transporter permease [Myxococcota bacterium]|nr:ABC transporter permease [Myxococcales bacterium]